jgi:hypothetical protein
LVLRGLRARQRRKQPSELALKDLASAEEFIRDLADHVYVAGDQLFRTDATRVAERIAEGLIIGKSLLCEVEDVSLVAEGFYVVKDLNTGALGSILATHGDGDLIDQGEIVRDLNIGLSVAVIDDAHPADLEAEGPADNCMARLVEGGTVAGARIREVRFDHTPAYSLAHDPASPVRRLRT